MSSLTARPRDLANLRDLGGLPTEDGGRTRAGVLWRSDAPLADDTTRGPDGGAWPPPTVLDLREPVELRAPHPLAALGSTVTSMPLIGALAPGDRERGRTGGLGVDELYLLMLDTAAAWLPDLVHLAAHGPAPVLVHCAAGKDRTGVVVALLLRAAGVTREAVADDFALTNTHRTPLRDRLVAQGAVDADVDAERIGVTPAHLEAVLDRIGTDPAALLRPAGVDDGDVAAWRDRLLGPS